ncbi:tyrosine-protein phosphatase [Larkinella soli]|uniref:tyrosine-protein phosphatase n=1 Tax=Larkinella soli TaxID=1770527 RepID=UPI000FFB315D|nr:CpsB/CapC family capsule biosynthesis tyrosine phosphatase [Larkinella soli]
MFSFFSRKQERSSITDFGFLGVDIHSHLIPAIDDGVPGYAAALECLQGLQDLGYKKVITTPHVLQDYYPNTSFTIRHGLSELQDAVREAGLTIQVDAAAEYLVDDHFLSLLRSGDLLTWGPNYLLIELPFAVPPLNLEDIIFQIMTRGYQPVLAHPERYSYLKEHPDRLQKIKEQGCMFQLNLLSLMGQYGSRVQQYARQLVEQSMIDFLGSDAHRPKDIEKLGQLIKSGELSILESHQFMNRSLA